MHKFTLVNKQESRNNVYCTLYIHIYVHCTLYTVHCTLYTVHCTYICTVLRSSERCASSICTFYICLDCGVDTAKRGVQIIWNQIIRLSVSDYPRASRCVDTRNFYKTIEARSMRDNISDEVHGADAC